jgi:16S rRNA (cytosine967-C5)-methyltransferase
MDNASSIDASQRRPSARDLVTGRIAVRARQFPDLHLVPLDTGPLDARDSVLARAIDQAVARRWLTLAAVLRSRLDQPWDRVEAKVKAPLLVGAAQLLLLDRLPDHAIINAAVQWTKWRGRGKASGLVNAVLRRVSDLRAESLPGPIAPAALDRDVLPRHDGRAWRLKEAVFAEDPVDRLAEQTSHPTPLLAHWINAFGHEAAARLAMHDLVQPPITIAGLPPDTDEPALEPHREPGFFVLTGRGGELADLLDRHPGARVQDVTTAAAVTATADLRPNRIVDVCAGRGTKTRQLMAAHPESEIIATDVDPARAEILREQFDGAARVRVVDPDHLVQLAGTGDLVVLDVPCTNTGVLARRVEARYRFTDESLAALVDLQRQIIADALPLLASGGHLLYVTCSIEAAENERQIEWMARWHALETIRQSRRDPAGWPGDPPGTYADGGFHALLRST